MPLPANPGSSIRSTKEENEAFSEIVGLIAASRERALQAVNTALIGGLYTKRQKSHANDLRTLCFEVLTPRLMDREAQAKRELISLLESAEFGR
jgi:hypothetical protein